MEKENIELLEKLKTAIDGNEDYSKVMQILQKILKIDGCIYMPYNEPKGLPEEKWKLNYLWIMTKYEEIDGSFVVLTPNDDFGMDCYLDGLYEIGLYDVLDDVAIKNNLGGVTIDTGENIFLVETFGILQLLHFEDREIRYKLRDNEQFNDEDAL